MEIASASAAVADMDLTEIGANLPPASSSMTAEQMAEFEAVIDNMRGPPEAAAAVSRRLKPPPPYPDPATSTIINREPSIRGEKRVNN